MKSIVAEGSSIFEAVEKGWKKAGKPTQFSVKILEEPKKNFFGLTVRSAKVGIFFDIQLGSVEFEQEQEREQVKLPRKKEKIEPLKEIKKITTAKEEQVEEKRVPWTAQMIKDVNEWLKKTFEIINLPNIKFAVEPKHLFLRIDFEKPIFDEINREKKFFSSLSTLLLQMLKNKYKRPLKGYKIVLIGANGVEKK